MIKFRKKVRVKEPVFVVDWLAQEIDLSKMKIKKAISLGGLWIKIGNKPKKRVKKIKTELKSGEFIEFFYNPKLDVEKAIAPEVIYENNSFGVWFKPAGQPVASTPYSDQGCFDFFVKKSHPKIHLINRLDFEVSGLVIVAYTKHAAAHFSEELKKGTIQKLYHAEVLGKLASDGEIDFVLDEKECLTKYKVLGHGEDSTWLEVDLVTGRFHQIRRHLDMIDHPIMGDPKYGYDNADSTGLKLQAIALSFPCPRSGKTITVEVPPEKRIYTQG